MKTTTRQIWIKLDQGILDEYDSLVMRGIEIKLKKYLPNNIIINGISFTNGRWVVVEAEFADFLVNPPEDYIQGIVTGYLLALNYELR